MANVGIYDMTDTWNNAGTAFTAIKMNVTDTASASGSRLLDVQKGGSSLFVIDKDGNVGIGTTSPGNFNSVTFGDSILDVNGVIQVRGDATNGAALLGFGGDTYRKALLVSSVGTDDPYLAFYTASSGSNSLVAERMRIDSSGNVGIGTSSPAFADGKGLHLHNGAGTARLHVTNNTTGATASDGGELTVAGSDLYVINNESATTQFWVGGSERMRITSDGYLRMASGSGGIQFNGDTAAANALDDYEEGSFTPSLSAETPPASPAAGSGSYIKVGGVVHFELEFLNVSTGGSGYLLVTGLPFTKSGGINYPINVTMSYLIDTIPFAGRVQGSTIDFFDIKDLTYRTPTSTGSGRYLYVTGTYRVT